MAAAGAAARSAGRSPRYPSGRHAGIRRRAAGNACASSARSPDQATITRKRRAKRTIPTALGWDGVLVLTAGSGSLVLVVSFNTRMFSSFIPLVAIATYMLCVFAFAVEASFLL
jgi:hypothetical protein